MGPVRVKVYGLFPRTRRRYVTEAFVGGLLLLAALVAWWLGWPELEARLKRLPQVRGVVATEAVLANVPWMVLAAAVLKSIELIVVLRRFTRKEALQNVRGPQPQPPTRETLSMPSSAYAPTREDKFAFGVWCLQNRGRDPFGDQTRPELPALECIRGLAQRNCYGFEFHDNDVIPFGASASQRDQILRDLKKAIGDWGIRPTMATTNTFYHPVFKDGAFTSTDPAVRLYSTQKVMRAIDVAAELGTQVFVFWGGREGVEVDASKDPVEATKWFREALNFLCNYVLSQGYDLKFSIEPKPNEPRGDLYLPTVGSVLAFIATLDHPEMCGINPETAHIKMAGLNPYHEFAQALDAGKLLDVHLNGQKPLRFDQDLSFGSDDLKDAFFTTKLLLDHQYAGTVGFDAHPYRSEADPWDFVDRNMRTYKIMKEKVRQFNENREIQDLLKEVHGANANLRGFTAKYSKEAAQKLKEMPLDPDALAKRKLPYERLDQLLTELLLGVL
jgi:xylose isomerase